MLRSSHAASMHSRSASAAVVPRLHKSVPYRAKPIVAFKEEDKEAADQRNAAARGKEALDKILHRVNHGDKDALLRKRENVTGADSSTNTASTATSTAPPAPAPARPVKPSIPPAFKASLSVPVFSRRREVFVGRAAMAGFYASCMWEAFTMGLGPLSQLSVLSGLPPFVVQGVIAAFVVHGLWGLSPTTPTWSAQNRQDMLRRPKGPPRAWINPLEHPDQFLGYSEWGFTKRNELFAGRLAMLGFLGTCWTEPVAQGRGALGQLAWHTHLPVSQSYYQFCNLLLVVTPIVFGVLAYVQRKPGQFKGGDEIY